MQFRETKINLYQVHPNMIYENNVRTITSSSLTKKTKQTTLVGIDEVMFVCLCVCVCVCVCVCACARAHGIECVSSVIEWLTVGVA